MGLDAQGRPRAHDVRHLTAHHSAAPLFPPLNDQTEAAQAIRSTLLYSYFVDKDTRSLVPADRHRVRPRTAKVARVGAAAWSYLEYMFERLLLFSLVCVYI